MEHTVDYDVVNGVLDTIAKFEREYFPREKRLQLDREDIFPEDIIRKLLSPDIGLHLIFLPEEYEGFGGTVHDINCISMELAKLDLGLATAFLAISLGTDPLRVGGTEDQKRYWMTRIAREGLIVAYAVTEPGAGSDLAAFKTKADPIFNESDQPTAYRLNGVKQFITNGGVADVYSVLAMTPAGPSFFIVERGVEGLQVGSPEEKHGIRLSNTSQVIFDDVVIPADQLVGLREGQGLAQAVAVFGYTRLMVAAFGLGAGEAALERAIAYAKERVQFGKPLIQMQGYTHKLIVPHAVRLAAAKAYIEEIAHRLDAGETGLETEGAVAKYFATEVGNMAAEAAIQALGGYGYMHEYEVEKIKRDVRVTTIYEGTSEIMQTTIGKDRWRLYLQTRGQWFHNLALELEEISITKPHSGASCIARAVRTLSAAFEQIRINRLTRQQHVLFLMADMITGIETAAALCRKVLKVKNEVSAETSAYLSAAARIYASEVAALVADKALLCVTGFKSLSPNEIGVIKTDLNLDALFECYQSRGADMDILAQMIASKDKG